MQCARALRTKIVSKSPTDLALSGWLSRRLAVLGLALALSGCAGSGIFAPVKDISDLGVNGTYRVQPGDTLSSIARETGVSVDRLIALNGISNPALIRVGQRLRLSDDASVTTAMRAGDDAAPAPSAAPVSPSRTAEVKPADESTITRAADAGKIDMVWPAKGKIIQGFTTQTKGIDIEGTLGEPVVAAAGGDVVFAGNGVRGFGNLVIVDHGDGFITAYAHNEKLMVKKGDKVTKGQQIATLGQSATTSPRLHFEVRRNGTPVNPLSYLPDQG